jgi:hypothetical protein
MFVDLSEVIDQLCRCRMFHRALAAATNGRFGHRRQLDTTCACDSTTSVSRPSAGATLGLLSATSGHLRDSLSDRQQHLTLGSLSVVSFNDLVSAGEYRGRDRQAERFGGLEIDHQLESCRLNHREVRGFVAIQYSANIDAGLAIDTDDAGATDQSPATTNSRQA